jgi:hypothetical protein
MRRGAVWQPVPISVVLKVGFYSIFEKSETRGKIFYFLVCAPPILY